MLASLQHSILGRTLDMRIWRLTRHAISASRLISRPPIACATKTIRKSISGLSYGDSFRTIEDLNRQRWLFDALKSAEVMQQQGVAITRDHCQRLLRECVRRPNLECVRRIQGLMARSGLDIVEQLVNLVIHILISCGQLEEAEQAFRKIPKPTEYAWNAIVTGYARLEPGEPAIAWYNKMAQVGTKPCYVYLRVLQACSATSNLTQGRLIHREVVNAGLEQDLFVGSSLVDMYCKCGSIEEARKVFDELKDRNMVAWGSIIAAYAENDEGLLALDIYQNMLHEGVKPDKVLFSSILKACGNVGAIRRGRRIQEQIRETNMQPDAYVWNAVFDMYGKCGSIEEARKVFNTLPSKDIVSWNVMMLSYIECGNIKMALQCWKDIYQEALKPDGVIKPNDGTFTVVLIACCNAGLVDEGTKYFKSMTEEFGVLPNASHYFYMVELLGSAGLLKEAEELLLNVKAKESENLLQNVKTDAAMWTSLLAACRRYNNMEIGRRCFDQIVQLDPQHAAGYVLMSNMYSNAQMFNDAAYIQDLKLKNNAVKHRRGKAWVDVSSQIQDFIARDKSRPLNKEMQDILRNLSNRLRQIDPTADLGADEEEDVLCGHPEVLAVAYALARGPVGNIIRVIKNIKMCLNCHNTIKMISKVERREIIVRADHCMHHFKNGMCCCANYHW